jgi:hypothetical protein
MEAGPMVERFAVEYFDDGAIEMRARSYGEWVRYSDYATLEAYAHEATKAITNLTAGGSEYFGRKIGGMYTADLPFCVKRIRERDTRAHDWLVEETKKRRAAAQLRQAREALERIREQDRVTRFRGTEKQFYENGPCGEIARTALVAIEVKK